ncbi:MAG: twin-arginine translocase subunit TatC [Flavobacteriales bacterium]|jgi:sec-independent protein translocase protein TatC|nr:twin-arginine translocase subunit TatC [Flavobacteriales bacterium]MDG1934242.1 twin-arginine translocase subunit TatC [Flavobacteriales bacterium]MDG2087094.1 twin-arginine translocase subunit TatC [Flavobacteriales bacterium]|tara:strand:+ start:996 stop:1808 length:813 start_codon:yes stop_codon:yes gene_type:complete
MTDKDKEMSFLDHLEVFRWHLIRAAIAILFFTIIAFIYKDIVFDVILLGPKRTDFLTYRILCEISQYLGLGDTLCLRDSPFSLMNISMSGQFSTHITTSIFAGFIIAFPYVLWEIWRFISPALHSNENSMAKGVVFFSSILFLIGILFGYYVIAPLSINFLGSYQVSSSVANQINLSSFVSTVTTVSFANGIIFELPILVYFLTKIGLLTPDFMRVYRKHSMVVILILSAIITPPDITSQVLVSLPLIILYEFSIKISERVIKNQENIQR